MTTNAHRRSTASHFMRCLAASAASVIALTACASAQQQEGDEVKTAPSAPARPEAEGHMLPSSLVYYVHMQNYLQPDWSQKAIAAPLVAYARKEGLDAHERFFLAQLYFMSFDGDRAYELFAEFLDRDDWYGWMARMRHAIIDARFYENFERLEQGVNYERENFAFNPDFADMPGFGERSLCSHWAETGEHARALELAMKTIAQTPKDAPYGTLRVVEACYQSFEAMDRSGDAFELAEDIIAQMSAALQSRGSAEAQHPAYDEKLYDNIIEDWWYHRSKEAPYNYQSHNFEEMIARYEKFLACRRDKKTDSCPG